LSKHFLVDKQIYNSYIYLVFLKKIDNSYWKLKHIIVEFEAQTSILTFDILI